MTSTALHQHLKTGHTHVCQCWSITRSDGLTLGFTDHDRDLEFNGITYVADSGMNAKALASTSGMSVNNTEALGILTADSITETDIAAGRYDAAEVIVWRVQWDDVSARQILFRGSIGEITRAGGSFRADLRGLTDALNQPQGRSYLKTCSAVLGDTTCKVSLEDPLFVGLATIDRIGDGQKLDVVTQNFQDRWFVGGMVEITSGEAKGLTAAIKHDRLTGARRRVELWQAITIDMQVGDTLRLIAGCDKRAETCRAKFANLVNFQGFPHIPGDDWLMSVPRSDKDNTGGSLTP
ncbi:DUF2163 domain-containing protein [Yoonia sp. 208BN28-4]|uniref:DUF2163 domain-containing protein n=1 Tax=Yoonia sp. 208BN28-4 TaxID=3126505 RepID=UPI00309929E1